MWMTRYQDGMDLSVVWASRKRDRKSRELVEDPLSEQVSDAVLRSATRASPNSTMGFMRTAFRCWKMGFFAQSRSNQGICEIYRFVGTQVLKLLES